MAALKYLKWIVLLLLVILCVLFAGCINIMQYQRQYLSDPVMRLNGDELEKKLDSHVYPRREGSSGGDIGASGGCGC